MMLLRFPGEESRYAAMRAIIAAAQNNPELKKALIDEATKCEEELVDPLLQFRNWGVPLGNGWSSTSNNAAFWTDYFARTACAKSNILVNAPRETKYIYQGPRLQGRPAQWRKSLHPHICEGPDTTVLWLLSLTLYDHTHFFVPNELNRFSLGTKNKDLVIAKDGSLTIYVQADPPSETQRANWLPAPKGDFTLYLRAY